MPFSKGYIFESLQDSKRKDKHGRGQGHKKKEVDPLQSDMPLGKKYGFCNTIFSEGIKRSHSSMVLFVLFQCARF